MYQRVPDRIYFDQTKGRTMQHQGYATRIHWSTAMLDYLRRHFPTTLNEELAGCLGVSPRTMIRKARELGLSKDPQWLADVWEERRKLAHFISRRLGYPGGFKKGERANPDGEFKPGHKPTEEMKRKRAEGVREYNKRHPKELRERGLRAWETRRKKMTDLRIAPRTPHPHPLCI